MDCQRGKKLVEMVMRRNTNVEGKFAMFDLNQKVIYLSFIVVLAEIISDLFILASIINK